jgi:hypothetical protein
MPTQEIVGHATARRDTGLIRPLEVDDCLTSPRCSAPRTWAAVKAEAMAAGLSAAVFE